MRPEDRENFSTILETLRNNKSPKDPFSDKRLCLQELDLDEDDITALFQALAHNI